jgi:hypothetical protein
MLVEATATVTCSHGGKATPTGVNPRVTLGGVPSMTIATTMTIAGCAFPPPTAGNGPCVTGQWLVGTTRVLSNGQPLVVQSSTSLCAPTGTPMIIMVPQARVMAQ